MNLEDVTAILREHVDPGLEAIDLARGTVGNSQETWFVEARSARGGEPVQSCSAAPPRPAFSRGPTASRSTRRSAPSRVTGCPSRRCSRSASTSAPSSSWNDSPAPRPAAWPRTSAGRSDGRSAPCSLGSTRSTRTSSASTPPASPSDGDAARRCASYQRLYRVRAAGAGPAPRRAPRLGGAELPAGRRRAPLVLWGDPGRTTCSSSDGHVSAPPRLGAHPHRRPARRSRRGGLEPASDRSTPTTSWPATRRSRGRSTGSGSRLLRRARERDAVGDGRQRHGGLDRRRRELARRTPGSGSSSSRSTWRGARGPRAGATSPHPTACRRPIRSGRIRPRPSAGFGRWLARRPGTRAQDRRLRQMAKRAARAPRHDREPDPARSRRGCLAQPSSRWSRRSGPAETPRSGRALLADLAREIERLEPLARLHGHPPPCSRARSGALVDERLAAERPGGPASRSSRSNAPSTSQSVEEGLVDGTCRARAPRSSSRRRAARRPGRLAPGRPGGGEADPLGDQRSVVGDRWRRARVENGRDPLGSAGERVEVRSERGGPDGRVRGVVRSAGGRADSTRCARSGDPRRGAVPVASSTKSVSVGLCPGRSATRRQSPPPR